MVSRAYRNDETSSLRVIVRGCEQGQRSRPAQLLRLAHRTAQQNGTIKSVQRHLNRFSSLPAMTFTVCSEQRNFHVVCAPAWLGGNCGLHNVVLNSKVDLDASCNAHKLVMPSRSRLDVRGCSCTSFDLLNINDCAESVVELFQDSVSDFFAADSCLCISEIYRMMTRLTWYVSVADGTFGKYHIIA